MKQCKKCEENKEFAEFYIRNGAGRRGELMSECRSCVNIRTRRNTVARKSPEERAKHATWMREYKRDNPDLAKGMNLKRYWPGKDWRESLAEFNRLFAEQSGCCRICNKHQSEMRQAICVDHCAETGRVRGLLCHECNRAIGMLQHNTSILQSAIDYLEGQEGHGK